MYLQLIIAFTIILTEVSHSSGDINHTRHPRQTKNIECTLPPYPSYGKWTLLKGKAKPGDKIYENNITIFECIPGYQLSSDIPYRICDEKWRTLKFPECEVLCPPLFSSNTYELTCKHKTGMSIGCNEATDGSFVEYECARFYEIPPENTDALQCKKGEWSQKPACQPICGERINVDAKPVIFGSKPNEKLEYPWTTALYSRVNDSYLYNCGGSILSPTIVLTAAHCVTNNNGDALSHENYVVGAGKLYRKYKALEDKNAQYLEISKIIPYASYKADIQHFKADIAVLVTKGEFALNEIIRPVCFNNLKQIPLLPGKLGEVSGWGLTEGDVQSEKLRTLKIPYKYETICGQELPPDWADKYYMEDKICAGFVNQSKAVCDGDSGSGFVFKNRDGKYYIHGIVSLAHQIEGHCNIQQNSLYTRVAFYFDFVRNLMTKYAPKIRDCKLPPYPENGKWIIFNDQNKKPGESVPAKTILKVECDKGFITVPLLTYIECGSAHNMPTCKKSCPKLIFPKGTVYQCFNEEKESINCSHAIQNSKVLFSCPKGYFTVEKDHICKNGSWIKIFTDASCHLSERIECGKPEYKYGWNVGLYKYDENAEGNYTYFCGGTLIDYAFVLTAAHCVTDETGQILPFDNYMVAAGKAFVKYNDPRDKAAQYVKISKILVHQFYRGKTKYYLGDVAVLMLQNAFEQIMPVQTVCMDNEEIVDLELGTTVGMIPKYKEETPDETEGMKVKYVDSERCDSNIGNRSFGEICGRISNPSNCLSPSDSGKGFVVINPATMLYYVKGIVNTNSIDDGKCQKNVTITPVDYFKDYISYETRSKTWFYIFSDYIKTSEER